MKFPWTAVILLLKEVKKEGLMWMQWRKSVQYRHRRGGHS